MTFWMTLICPQYYCGTVTTRKIFIVNNRHPAKNRNTQMCCLNWRKQATSAKFVTIVNSQTINDRLLRILFTYAWRKRCKKFCLNLSIWINGITTEESDSTKTNFILHEFTRKQIVFKCQCKWLIKCSQNKIVLHENFNISGNEKQVTASTILDIWLMIVWHFTGNYACKNLLLTRRIESEKAQEFMSQVLTVYSY